MRSFDIIITCSQKGASAAIEQWNSARGQGLLEPRNFTRRDALDLQMLTAIFMRIQGTLTLEVLEKCTEFVEQAGIAPETQIVYLGFIFDLAYDAGVAGLRMKQEVHAKVYDWEVADVLSKISPTFDKRVAKIRAAFKSVQRE